MNQRYKFKRFGIIGYLPVDRPSAVVILMMVLSFITIGSGFFLLGSEHPILAWACGIIAVIVALFFNAFIAQNIEE
jgi:hypothetical protein